MHVLEVLLVATLFTSAINVAVNILPTSDANNVEENDLYFSGLEILEMLDNWQPSDAAVAAEHDGSTLAWWLATGDDASIKQYLDAGLPPSVSYRLEATHGGQTEVIVDREVPSGSVVQAFRIVLDDLTIRILEVKMVKETNGFKIIQNYFF